MRKRISVYDYCEEVSTTFLNVHILTYDEYLLRETHKPISEAIFDLYTNDIILLRSLLLHVCMFAHLEKHRLKYDAGKVGELIGDISANFYKKRLLGLGLTANEVLMKITDYTSYSFNIMDSFQENVPSNLLLENYSNEFCKYYCSYIFKKYNLDLSDVNTTGILVGFISTQHKILLLTLEEWDNHYKIR